MALQVAFHSACLSCYFFLVLRVIFLKHTFFLFAQKQPSCRLSAPSSAVLMAIRKKECFKKMHATKKNSHKPNEKQRAIKNMTKKSSTQRGAGLFAFFNKGC